MSNLAISFFVAGALTGVDPALISSVCYVESGHRPNAINHADNGSPSYGVCQIKLATARMLGFIGKPSDLMRPETNILYAAKYLRKQSKRYRYLRDIVSSYNAGRAIQGNQRYVNRVLSQYRKLTRKETYATSH